MERQPNPSMNEGHFRPADSTDTATLHTLLPKAPDDEHKFLYQRVCGREAGKPEGPNWRD